MTDYRIEANEKQIGSAHSRNDAIQIAKSAARRRYRLFQTGTVYVIENDPERDEEEDGVKSIWDSRCMTEDNLAEVLNCATRKVTIEHRAIPLDGGRGPKST